MEYQSGQVVYSKSGHDKGDTLMVLFVEGAYVYLADGKRRKIEKPKRKKMIDHCQNDTQNNTDQYSAECQLQCNTQTVPKIFPSIILNEVHIKLLLDSFPPGLYSFQKKSSFFPVMPKQGRFPVPGSWFLFCFKIILL